MAKTQVVDDSRPAEGAAEAGAPTCRHHWLIESPQGALSHGRCKRCGEEREFRNSATDHLWEDGSGGGYNAWRGVRSAPRPSDDEETLASGSSDGIVLAV
jgi:hypothetical protein